jgi:hypothetical protein
MNRRRFLLSASIAVPMPAFAEPPLGVVRELSGEAYLSGHRMARNTALQPGQTLETGEDAQVWFTVGEDAFLVRPRSRVRLDASSLGARVLDFVRLVSGGLAATFSPGAPRRLVTPTSTIGIRGTGVYLEATPQWTYACTCFGTTEISPLARNAPLQVASRNHAARRIDRDGSLLEVPFERHTSDEIARLESLVGRPNPFKP